MVTTLLIQNRSLPNPVLFKGIGYSVVIPGRAVDFVCQIPTENALEDIRTLLNNVPSLEVLILAEGEGIPIPPPVPEPPILSYIGNYTPIVLRDENYKGVWDASSGSVPHVAPETGWYWRVSVPGTYNLDGIDSWLKDDFVKWTGILWMKAVGLAGYKALFERFGDGDKLEIDWIPGKYLPAKVDETDNASQLSAHLKGIDEELKKIPTDIISDYSQSEADIADAVSKKHAHDNMDALAVVSGVNTGDQDLEPYALAADVAQALTEKSPTIHDADAKTDPIADGDEFGAIDSQDSSLFKKILWSNIKATLKSYFDTLYNKYVHPDHSGDVSSSSDGTQTIAQNAVTLAKMALMATGAFLGRNTSEPGNPEVIPISTAKTMLGIGPEDQPTFSALKLIANESAPEPISGTSLHVVGPDGIPPRLTFDGIASGPSFNFRRANGTGAAPSAIAAGDTILALIAFGYGATGYGAQRAVIQVKSAENWTDSAQGTYITFTTTAPGGIAGGEKIRIAGDGKFGILTSSPQEALHVVGNVRDSVLAGTGNRAVYSDGNGNLTNSSSDQALKKDVEVLTYGLSEILRLRPVRFRWKQPALFGSQQEIGFIAQETGSVIPELVGMNADGMLSLDYAKLASVLCKAIQELSSQISDLRTQLEAHINA